MIGEKMMENKNRKSELFSRECELKYKIDLQNKDKYMCRLIREGFEKVGCIVETDYTPDVEGFLCKKAGVMLRIRKIIGSQNDLLVTLKVKRDNSCFQDNDEIEFLASEFDQEIFDEINGIIFNCTGKKVPKEIIENKKMAEIICIMERNGFSVNRMLSQKKRDVYRKNGVKISFDTFPKDIGTYMEVETFSPEELIEFVTYMGYDQEKIEKRNYGKLIQDSQKDLNANDRRICVFEDKKEYFLNL